MDVYENIRKSGYELPPSPPKGGIYKPVKQVGNLLYISNQGTTRDGQSVVSEKPESGWTIEEDQEAARICTLNALGVLHKYLSGLNKIKSVVRTLTFVASAPGFSSQPAVVNDASRLLKDISGNNNGVSARSTVSAIELPGNVSVEIELTFEI